MLLCRFWHPSCNIYSKRGMHPTGKFNRQEEAMKTINKTIRTTKTNVEHDVAVVIFNIVAVSAVLIGLWAAACLVGGILEHGVSGLINGYITAVTGR